MDKSGNPTNIFCLGDDFDKDWRNFAAKGRHRITPQNAIDIDNDAELDADYQWFKHALMLKVIATKTPTSLLDQKGHPLMQEVYALRHGDRKLIQSIVERYNNTNSNEITQELIESCQHAFETAYYADPKPVFYYKLCPDDYFILYDAPLLMYLYSRHRSQPRPHMLQVPGCSERYQSIFDKTPKKWQKNGWFGITIQQCSKLKDGHILSVPAFCEKGRLEAFHRFITHRGKSERIHMFQYFTRCLPNYERLEPPDFRDEDAWYFEMCTGLALVTELTALLVDLGAKSSLDTNWAEAAMAKWSDCRLVILSKLLWDHHESIIRCPAIYWRVASLRNVIRQVDSQCVMKEFKRERQIKLAYTEEYPESCPATQQEWYMFAKRQFEKYFFTDLDGIGIIREPFRMQQFSKNANLTLPENYLVDLTDPTDLEFMYAARDIGTRCLQQSVETTTIRILETSTIDSYTTEKENTGFYFRGCLPKEDCIVEDMVLGARTPPYGNSEKKLRLEKLRNANKNEAIFEIIHQKLYGANSAEDLGFLPLEGL